MVQTPEGAKKSSAKKYGMTLDELESKLAAGLKHCTKCRTWRPRVEFNIDRHRGDGLSTKCHACIRVKQRKDTKGRPSAFKGRTHTAEAKAAMSVARKGRPGIGRPKGRKHTIESRRKMSEARRKKAAFGPDNPNFKDGLTEIRRGVRFSAEYARWRQDVFLRDSFTCQECGDCRGGNLQAHHIKSFASHPELRFDVNNGVTLCRDCHERLHLKPIPTPADLRRRKKHVG